MKVDSTTPIQPVQAYSGPSARQSAETATESGGAVKVNLSSDAEFVRGVREDASPSGIRDDLVADIRTQIANGTFESGIDMDRMLDSLMADL